MAAPPKRNLLPFLLLLALSTLFLFSLYPTTPTPTPIPQATPYADADTHPTTSITTTPLNFTLTIKVLTFNRLAALSRCLRSLSAAHYDAATTVHLHIYIDHFDISSKGSEQISQSLNLSRQILDFVDRFEWAHGEKLVHYRTSNAGLQAQWLEAWWPSSDHEFAFVVEDDLEVSPLYYSFLKAVILNYYYNQSNFSPLIYGASLQRPRFVPGKHGNKMQLDSETRLFLYQLVGTWGQLLFPRPWKEFRLWYDEHKAKGLKPFLEGMVTTGWYKKMGERIWTPWFIKFIHARGYFNIYTNFIGERALSVSHRDAGVNYGKTVGPDSHLMDETSTDLNLVELPSLSHLKWYDFCFREVIRERIVRNFNELGSVLQSVQKSDAIILVSLYRASESIIRNLLCHLERLNIHNYLFAGPKSDMLLDLARRGHPVIDGDEFFESVRLHKLLKIHESAVELIKEIVVRGYVIKACLELGYTSWVVDGNMIPITASSFSDPSDLTKDFYVGETSKFLSVRGSLSARKIWVNDFVYKVVTLADSARRKDSGTMEDNFVNVVKQLLQEKSVKFDLVDEMRFVLNANTVDTNQTLTGDGKKFVFWPSEMGSDIIDKKLVQLGLWAVDSDLSCTAVVCHSS